MTHTVAGSMMCFNGSNAEIQNNDTVTSISILSHILFYSIKCISLHIFYQNLQVRILNILEHTPVLGGKPSSAMQRSLQKKRLSPE